MSKTPFVIDEIADISQALNGRLFPLPRADHLKQQFANMFSAHLGRLRSGGYLESEVIVVTGLSGAGKTAEIEKMKENFNADKIPLPGALKAKMISRELDRKGGWKALGSMTLKTMGYPLSDNARLDQTSIWDRVAQQGRLQGVVVINYDEVQHIFAGKSGAALEEVLDSFKSILKSKTWPIMLILSGLPELSGYIESFEQLFRKVTHISFSDIAFETDVKTVHEIIGSFAIEARLEMAPELNTHDFIHRLVTAGAFRWGLVCQIVTMAVAEAAASHSKQLTKEHFVQIWVSKTEMNRAATPFTHSAYETVFRRDAPFRART
jgi:hypothetical protein